MRVVQPALVIVLFVALVAPLHAQQSPRLVGASPQGATVSLLSEGAPRGLNVAAGGEESGEEAPAIWLGGGVGIGSYGLSTLIDVSVRGENPNVFMARWAGTMGLHPDANDLGLLYGRSYDGVAVLAGAGVAWGNRLKQFPDGVGTGPPIGPTLGLALQLRLPLVTFESSRFALTGFANVNADKPFGGVTLTVDHGLF
jgi:hypothetical protein